MSRPEIVQTYPNNGDTGIPVGAIIKIYFDRGVDISTLEDSLVLTGPDYDMRTGPDAALQVNPKTGVNPYLLTSPGFKGVVPLKVSLAYYDLTTEEISDLEVLSESSEESNNLGHVATITVDPKFASQLAADVEYTLYIIGDPSSLNRGISGRTIFDVQEGVSVGDGEIFVRGPWLDTGAVNDTVNVKITKTGPIGTSTFKWWYTSEGEGSAHLANMTNRRFRSLSDGLQIRFTGTDLRINDTWSFNVEAQEFLEESTKVIFTTNDGSYSSPPASASTPATSLPPSSVLPGVVTDLLVTSMIPANGSYNVSLKTRKIVIRFSEDLDETTITNDTVKLWNYPVSGSYEDTRPPIELQKTFEVEENLLTIRF